MKIPAIIKNSVPKACYKKKGDLATATDDGQLDTMSVGPDGTVLTADSTQPTGFKWGPATRWGNITGTLSNQTDLESALNGKEPANPNIQAHIANTANPHKVTADQIMPDQTGKSGKFLTSNGSTVSWGDPTAGTPPTGTGFRHVTGGAEDSSAKLVADADVAAAAAIVESKLALNYPTHSNANDPTTGEKAALAGTSGTPGLGNLYVTDADPRNTDARPPTAHGSAAHTGTIGTPAQVGLGNVTNDQQLTASQLDTDGTMAANSDSRVPSQKAAKSYADNNFAPITKGVTGGNAHDHTSGNGAAIPESGLSFSDVATGNVSTAQHGFMPKLPGGTSTFFRADGTFAVPPGGGLPNGGVTCQVLKKKSSTDGDASWYGLPYITVGDPGYGPLISDAITGIGTNQARLVVPPGTYAGATIPPNVTLVVNQGALINSGTLTVNGLIEAGDYQIFDPTGAAITFPSTTRQRTVKALWFAAGDDPGDGTGTDDTANLAAMITAFGTAPITLVFDRIHKVTSDLTFTKTTLCLFRQGSGLYLNQVAGMNVTNNAPNLVARTGTISVSEAGTIIRSGGTYGTADFCNGGPIINGYIKTAGGQVAKVKNVISSTKIEVFTPLNQEGYDEGLGSGTPVSWQVSGKLSGGVPCPIMSFSDSPTDLHTGDVFQIGGDTFVVMRRSGADVYLNKHVSPNMSSGNSYTLGARASFMQPIEAGRYQIFYGPGMALFPYSGASEQGLNTRVFPEWYGAVASGSTLDATANQAAFLRALTCTYQTSDVSRTSSRRPIVDLARGYYYFNQPVTMPNGSSLAGKDGSVDRTGTSLGIYSSQPTNLLEAVPGSSQYWGIISHTNFDNGNGNNTGNLISLGTNGNEDGWFIRYCSFRGVRGTGYAILAAAGSVWVENCDIDACTRGIKLYMDSWALNNQIAPCNPYYVNPRTNAGRWLANQTTMQSGDAVFPTTNPMPPYHFTWVSGTKTGSQEPTWVYTDGAQTDEAASGYGGDVVWECHLIDEDTQEYSRGLEVFGTGNTVSNNLIFGDAGGCTGIFINTPMGDTSFTGNRVDHFCYGFAAYGPGPITSNVIWQNYYGLVSASNGLVSGIITGNDFMGNTKYGVYLNSGNCKLARLANNRFSGNGTGPIALGPNFGTGGTIPIMMEDNLGIDSQVTALPALTDNSPTPSVLTGRNWTCSNSSLTNVTDFADKVAGKEIVVMFTNNNTTIKFNGSAVLMGNNGQDWNPAAGNWLRAVCDGTKWYCECH